MSRVFPPQSQCVVFKFFMYRYNWGFLYVVLHFPSTKFEYTLYSNEWIIAIQNKVMLSLVPFFWKMNYLCIKHLNIPNHNVYCIHYIYKFLSFFILMIFVLFILEVSYWAKAYYVYYIYVRVINKNQKNLINIINHFFPPFQFWESTGNYIYYIIIYILYIYIQ